MKMKTLVRMRRCALRACSLNRRFCTSKIIPDLWLVALFCPLKKGLPHSTLIYVHYLRIIYFFLEINLEYCRLVPLFLSPCILSYATDIIYTQIPLYSVQNYTLSLLYSLSFLSFLVNLVLC